ncbi:uncharacterized protein [Rutidosis leptorrhynchoides]|uniref:uncharacterized protein n=1 Tax=Rutidosis leptorrhynchoides TaxID=125765 RepID=UPI003A9A3F70
MDDFSAYGDIIESCLRNLELMLSRCEKSNLVLKWEKCHFMVREGIVLGHKISKAGIEVDKAKVDVIAELKAPTNVKGVRSFLGHTGFYRQFIKDFSKITKPLNKLLEKDAPFVFSKECHIAFNLLKAKLANSPILIGPDWSIPFELMCDASDFAIRSLLGKCIGKHFQPIYYASKTLQGVQLNYTTIEKELLAIVFYFDKFRAYLILAKKDKKGAEKLAADQLSHLEKPSLEVLDETTIHDAFLDEHLMKMEECEDPWFIDFSNYLVGGFLEKGCSHHKRKKFFNDLKYYFWEDTYLFRRCSDGMIRRCVSGEECTHILIQCHHSLAQALPTNDARIVVSFLKQLFSRFGVPKALISDRETHFCNAQLEKVLKRYGVTHKVSTSYHLQTNRTSYKMPTGTTPFHLLYGKVCHLPVEIEHKAFWALKTCNLDLKEEGHLWLNQLNELDELRVEAYDN